MYYDMLTADSAINPSIGESGLTLPPESGGESENRPLPDRGPIVNRCRIFTALMDG